MKENTNAPIYTLTGIVIHGRGIGKHVGTPTANMEIAKNTFLPKTGVYVADILLSDKRYYGVTHIGARPTLDNDDSVSIETHIFDFDKDIYGSTITVNLYKKLREVRKFNELSLLLVTSTTFGSNELKKVRKHFGNHLILSYSFSYETKSVSGILRWSCLSVSAASSFP